MKQKLRIAFLISDTKKIPAWYFETIEEVIANPEVSVFFIAIEDLNYNEKEKASSLYGLFKKFENWWFKSEHDSQRLVTIENLSQPAVPVCIVSTNHFQNNEKLIELKEMCFDIIYSIVPEISRNEFFSTIAKYGLWYIRFGIGPYSNLLPAAFWEVMNDESTIGSCLFARKDGKDIIIYEGTTSCVPYSVKNTFNSVAWKSSSYLPVKLNGLIALEENFFAQLKCDLSLSKTKERFPSNFAMPLLFLKNFANYIVYKFKRLRKDRFTILISNERFEFEQYGHYQAIDLPKKSFYADPFVIESDGVNYIFFEDYYYPENKGRISVIEVDAFKKKSSAKIVLDKPYHLSYPFVFMHNDDYYMVPETTSNNTVELYRAKNFPQDWEFVINLAEGKTLIDVTLHFENDLWWMFANSANHAFASTNDQLFLYYSESLFSNNWLPHPQNPIATHISNCRPAGRLFRKDGKLYRPAQNNASKQYGYGLNINEVITLNKHEYAERIVFTFDKNKLNLETCHNLDFTNSLTVIDGIVK